MKNIKKLLAVCLCFGLCFLVSCSDVDTASDESKTSSESKYENIEIPKISSDDAIMPTYVDISLYNVENYADIYLGDDFKFKTTYAGSELEVPSTYKKMVSKGFELKESDEYNKNSVILAGKKLQAQFVNEYSNEITAVFYNASNSSVELNKCKIVKFIIPENSILTGNTTYGPFFVNGVSNESAVTDIIEYLGAPSHFYRVNEDEYYLDYFISKDDLRSGITLYFDPKEDNIKSIEFSNFN